MLNDISLLISNAILDKLNNLELITNIVRLDSDYIEATYKSGKTSKIKVAGIAIDGVDGKDGLDGRDGVDGKDGLDGRDGIDGKDGLNGRDGVDGKDGLNGKDGINGLNGKDGLNGRDGLDGKDGVNGLNGNDGLNGRDGVDGKDGAEGNGIMSASYKNNQFIIVTRDKTYNLGSLKFSRGGGEVFRYTNSLPMPNDVGGIPAGTTFDNVSSKDLWTKLLYAYDDPIFSSFSIADIPTELEVGYPIPAGVYDASWVIDSPEMLKPNSISIKYVNNDTTLASGLSNTGSEPINIPHIEYDVPTSIIFRISAENTMNEVFYKDMVTNVKQRIYVGESFLAVLTPPTVKGLRISRLDTNINGEYELLGGGYKWFCYPASWGERLHFKDVDTGLSVPMASAFTFMISNDAGDHGGTTVEEAYKAYRTFNMLGGAITISVK